MNDPESVSEAENTLAGMFESIGGVRPRVRVLGRDAQRRVVVAVSYSGNELVTSMHVEAFVVARGDTVRHHSHLKHGSTQLVYQIEPKRFR